MSYEGYKCIESSLVLEFWLQVLIDSLQSSSSPQFLSRVQLRILVKSIQIFQNMFFIIYIIFYFITRTSTLSMAANLTKPSFGPAPTQAPVGHQSRWSASDKGNIIVAILAIVVGVLCFYFRKPIRQCLGSWTNPYLSHIAANSMVSINKPTHRFVE